MKISIIIPTYNEAKQIEPCLKKIRKFADAEDAEIIIADAPSSSDNLAELIKKYDCTFLKTEVGGRNHQMNAGAKIATAELLYFVHADVIVHKDFLKDILQQIKSGTDLGCYRYKFQSYPSNFLYINSFFTRFPMIWCRGGDQTLFIKKTVFDNLGGFDKAYCIMEDFDIIQRGWSKYKFEIIPKDVIVSSRKYEKNSYWKVQRANLLVMRKWRSGDFNLLELSNYYKTILK